MVLVGHVNGGIRVSFGRWVQLDRRTFRMCQPSVVEEAKSAERSRPVERNQSVWRAFRARCGTPVGSVREIVQSKEVFEADALILGETHDDPVAHELEKEMFRELTEVPKRKPILSMEILERDVQLVVDEYMQGAIRESDFKANARLPFNYDSDYRALVEMAKERQVQVLAANAPRRYVALARRVGRENLESSLPAAARSFLPPLPYAAASEQYAHKFSKIMAVLRGDASKPQPAPPGLLDAQSLWDASMAHAICSAAKKGQLKASSDRPLVFHIGGGFHVEHGLGIAEHIPKYGEGIRIATVVIQPGSTDEPFDPKKHKDIADFIIITDENVPRSYE
mmetsp:Transcript_3453/g.10465  ORF Transcript_3453/g.10465 Transcript_3453/m.10465 type:complete len:338 (+) Transcript_3453:74-1087(+)